MRSRSAAFFFQTLKRSLLLSLCLVVVMSSTAMAAGLAGDFDGDNTITTSDVVLLLAYIQSGKSTNADLVFSVAKEILPSVSKTISAFPVMDDDDLDGSKTLTTSDVVLLLAWIQSGRANNAATVVAVAKEILPSVAAQLSKFPGTARGSGTGTGIWTATDTGTGTGTGASTGTGTGSSTGTGTGATIGITINGIVPN